MLAMTTRHTRPTTTVLVALLLSAACVLATPLAAQQGTREGGDGAFAWRGAVPGGAWLRVRNLHGEIEVRAASGGEAEVRAERVPERRGKRREAVTFQVRREGSDVVVCAVSESSPDCGDEVRSSRRRDYGEWDGPEEMRVTVLLPRGVRVSALTGNGNVAVSGATADAVARSGNGRVTVGSGATRVTAATGNGAVTVEGAHGPVDARSGNGDVHVVTATGPVRATTGNGNVEARIDALRGEGDIELRTGNGRVLVLAPGDLAADVEATTGHGEVRTDFPLTVEGRLAPNRLRGRIGGGGRTMRLSSGNGSIDLRRVR